jgi:Ran-binding protein 9/10
VGFSAASVRLTRLPGWETNSYGYHGDDGKSYAAEKNGTEYGKEFGGEHSSFSFPFFHSCMG